MLFESPPDLASRLSILPTFPMLKLCATRIADVSADPTWEIAHNAYANVRHQWLPETTRLLSYHRPSGATHHMIWETLTHGDIGPVGR